MENLLLMFLHRLCGTKKAVHGNTAKKAVFGVKSLISVWSLYINMTMGMPQSSANVLLFLTEL